MNLPSQDITAEDEHGLRLLDRQFAQWVIKNFAPDLPVELRQALENLAMAVSHATALQHTCLDLQKVQAINEPLLNSLLKDITPEQLEGIVAANIPPLVVNSADNLVWLQKYHYFEQQCAEKLLAMAAETQTIEPSTLVLLEELFTPQLEASAEEIKGAVEQKAAAHMALASRLALITGGPGTGKTYTVARLIAVLVDQHADCRIVLAAPTGKAAQRMKDSIQQARKEDSRFALYEEAFDAISASARTLHSLLGIGRTTPKPWRNADNRLALDVLIVDEASMIDLPMMQRLLDAMPDHARLILLGDKDQLASVEAGSVLAELCQSGKLKSSLSSITVSRRFGKRPEIGELAYWLNGNADFPKPDFADNAYVLWHKSEAAKQWHPEWLNAVKDAYKQLLAAIKPGARIENILALQGKFQVLCALNSGPYGVDGINAIIEKALGKGTDKNDWYSGKPLIILQNDKDRKLYNGDVGMVLPIAADGHTIVAGSDSLKACFLTAEGIKAISKNQIPLYKTCYAITVHKSQGSEYERVVIVLPADSSDVASNPVLARELAYTAVTRAKTHVDIYAGEGVLEIMAQRQTLRMSGLALILDTEQ